MRNEMRRAVACLILGLAPVVASGEELLREIGWSEVAVESGEVVSEERGAVLRIESSGAEPQRFALLTIEPPGIASPRYAVRGQVRYEAVEGRGFLEMWSHFPDGGSYFSRTLGESGPMGALTGSSEWRDFLLPFYNDPKNAPPQRLVLNVVLPGKGTVWLGSLQLVQYGPGEDPLGAVHSGSWWSDPAAAYLGAIGGSVLGCLGAVIGVLGGMGRARGFVLGSLRVLSAIGALALAAGVLALLRAQPYAVYYPLLLLGIIALVVPLFTLPGLRRRYEQRELRRMRALDAG